MENNMMIIIWRDILVTFVLSMLARMVSGKEKFTIKCVGKPANSHLWRVNKNPPSYLFGTIHYPWDVLWKDPQHIHKNVKYAFKKSHSIYTELDFSNLTTINALQKCRFLPGNLTLNKILPKDLMFRLRKHLAYVRRTLQGWLSNDYETTYRKALAAAYLYRSITKNWKKKRPVWIVVLIMLELTPSSVRRQHQIILDFFLTKFGKSKGKSTGGLETAEDQCDPFNNINNRQAIFLLNYTLHLQELIRNGKMMPEHESEQDKILKVYLCGNLEKGIVSGSNRLLVNSNAKDHVAESQVKKIIEIEEYLMKELVFKRNKKMARRINELLKTNKTLTFFFAIGTGHLSGKSSVVELLQNKGYQIDHIKPDDYLSGQRKWEKRRARRKAIKKRKKKRQQQGNRKQQHQQQTRFDLFFRGTRRTTVAIKTRQTTPTVTWNHVPVVQPKEIPPSDNKILVQKQQNYVYYYTNTKPRAIGNLQTLMFCWWFAFVVCKLVT